MSDTETRLTVIEADVYKLKMQVKAMGTAFVLDDLGRPGFDRHRQYHLAQTRKAEEFESIQFDVTKRVVQTLIAGVVTAAGAGAVLWLQEAIK